MNPSQLANFRLLANVAKTAYGREFGTPLFAHIPPSNPRQKLQGCAEAGKHRRKHPTEGRSGPKMPRAIRGKGPYPRRGALILKGLEAKHEAALESKARRNARKAAK